MSIDQLAAPGGALARRGASPARSASSRAPGRAVAWLARLWAGHRSRRSLHGALHGLNDHMLADIGLHRHSARRGVRSPDPWLLAQHLR